MMALDLTTAALFTGMAGLVVALVVALVGRTLPPQIALSCRQMALGMGSYGLAFTIIACNRYLPGWASPVLANGLLVFSFVAVAIVLRRLLNLPTRAVAFAGGVVTAVCVAQNYWLLHASDLLNHRLAIGSACQLVVTAFVAVVPLQVRRREQGIGLWLVAAAFGVFGVFVVHRIWFLVSGAPMSGIFDQPTLQSMSYAAAGMLPLVAGLGFVQMYAQWTQRELQRLAMSDPLTGCFNRRGTEEVAKGRIEAARSAARPLAVLLLDLDELKGINDTAGHAAGDMALSLLAAELRSLIGPDDALGRIGGDEFVLLLENRSEAEALVFLETLRTRVQRLPLVAGHQISVSVGVAELRHGTDDFDTLLRRADEAMYLAKHGRHGSRRAPLRPD